MCTTRFCDEAAGPLSEPASLEVFLAILGPTMTNNDCGSSLLNIFIAYIRNYMIQLIFFVVTFKIFNLIIIKSHGTRVFFYYVFELGVWYMASSAIRTCFCVVRWVYCSTVPIWWQVWVWLSWAAPAQAAVLV